LIVVDWEDVPVFSTGETRSFEVWIQEDGEVIWLEYGEVGPGDPSAHLEVGAENRDGSSAKTLGTDTVPDINGYRVDMGSPSAGGTANITYDLFGKKAGSYNVKASMTTSVGPGTDIHTVHINVQ